METVDTGSAPDADAAAEALETAPEGGAGDGTQDAAPEADTAAAPIASPEDEAYAADLARFAAPATEAKPATPAPAPVLTAEDIRAATEDALFRRDEYAREQAALRAAEAERAAADAAEADDDRPLTRGEMRKMMADAASGAAQGALKPVLDRIEASERASQQALLAEARAERASRIDGAATLKHHPQLRADIIEEVDEAIESEIARRARMGNKAILTRPEMQQIVERVDRRKMRTIAQADARARPRAAAPAGTGAAPRQTSQPAQPAAAAAPASGAQPASASRWDRDARRERLRGAFGLN